MSGPGVRGVLLTGTIGAGKTTLAESVSERLHDADIRHALLDLDWLGQVYPPPDQTDPFNDSLAVRNLGVIWSNLLEAGIRHVVLAATVPSAGELQGIARAMPGSELTVVRVEASSEVVAARLRARDRGRLLEDFLRRTDPLARAIEKAALEAFAVTNDGRPLPELAEEILARLGWLSDG